MFTLHYLIGKPLFRICTCIVKLANNESKKITNSFKTCKSDTKVGKGFHRIYDGVFDRYKIWLDISSEPLNKNTMQFSGVRTHTSLQNNVNM